MRKIQLIILMMLIALNVSAQNKIKTYEYWFDNDYINKIEITIATPIKQFSLNTNVSTAGLTNGIHVISIRAIDESGKYSSTLSQFFYKMPVSPPIVNNLVAYEYWFDNDYANVVKTTTPAQHQVAINELISAQTLRDGIHIFNIRFKDNSNKYSSTLSQFFYKMPVSAPIVNNLVFYEYWFDNDYANVVKTTTPAERQAAINELISAQTLSNGIHVFNIRFKDNSNKWSSTLSQFFYKMPPSPASTNNLVSYQYWFDNDYANASTVNTSAQSQMALNELINAQLLTNGIHVFNIRFKDNSNKWSSTLSQFFYKMPVQTITNNLITNYRYWVDDDYANVVNVSLSVPIKQISLIDNLDFTQITKGLHTINFQFKDTLGLWSSVTTDSITKTSLPISGFSFTTNVECDSTVVNFTNQSVDGDTYLWNFGDEITDTLANPTHTYYTPGIYNVGLTITDTATLVSNTKLIPVLVTGNTFSSISATNCDSYTAPSGNHVFTTSGIYKDTIPNHWGCDSVITIDATIKYSTHVTDAITACEGYTWIDGVTYTTSNTTATHTLASFDGCDSIITLNLIINYGNIGTDIVTSCDRYTWIDGITYSASNSTATHSLINVNGCDSVITLNLTINQTPDTSVVQNGITLTAVATDVTYRWLDCNNSYAPIQGEVSQSFSATVNGSYALEVSKNECIGISTCRAVTTVGVLGNSYQSELIIYPNPTNGNLTINVGRIYPETVVKVYDIYGKLVNKFIFENKYTLEFYINDVPGVYLINLESGNRKAFLKVVKN